MSRLARGLIREFGAGAVIEAQLGDSHRVELVSARRSDGRYTLEREQHGDPEEIAVERILAMRVIRLQGPDESSGSREPRRPGPLTDSGAVALDPE